MIAVAGEKVRSLSKEIPDALAKAFSNVGWSIHLINAGMAAVSGPKFSSYSEAQEDIDQLRGVLSEFLDLQLGL